MFEIKIPKQPYSDPWNMPLIDRLNALSKGEPSVAYYYDYPDSSTFRYRVYNMIQVLSESSPKIASSYFSYKDQNYLDKVVDMADVLVICRARYNHKLNRAITKARNKGKTVFFDVDDLVFNIDYTHYILNTLAQDLDNQKVWDFWFGYIGRQNATLNLCERVITTNGYLAKILEETSHKPVSIIPNFMNREQIEISNKIFQIKMNSSFARNSRITMGYFSGTPSHNKDLEVITDALVELLDKYPALDLRVVGFIDIKPPLDRFQSRIQFLKLQDFINLQRYIGEVEINLVPLQENIFTNCKSDLKYFEAGIVGTLTIASPTFAYKNAIQDGKNGFLAQQFEWYEKISQIVYQIKDYYPSLAKRAREDSQMKYSWYNQAELVKKTLFTDHQVF